MPLLALVFLSAETAHGTPRTCPGSGELAVEADDEELVARLCEVAIPLREAITACGLKQNRVVTVEVVARLTEPFGTCLGHFDGASDRIRLVDPAAYPDVMIAGTVYDLFPQEVVVRLLLAHEMAHALAYQASGGRVGILDQEYIAAAMELELMAPDWRDLLIEAAPVSGPPQGGMIDIGIYAMAPRKFAVDAWRLFRLPGNGCELIRRIIDGEASFSKSAPPGQR